jgi:hypothetical protein
MFVPVSPSASPTTPFTPVSPNRSPSSPASGQDDGRPYLAPHVPVGLTVHSPYTFDGIITISDPPTPEGRLTRPHEHQPQSPTSEVVGEAEPNGTSPPTSRTRPMLSPPWQRAGRDQTDSGAIIIDASAIRPLPSPSSSSSSVERLPTPTPRENLTTPVAQRPAARGVSLVANDHSLGGLPTGLPTVPRSEARPPVVVPPPATLEAGRGRPRIILPPRNPNGTPPRDSTPLSPPFADLPVFSGSFSRAPSEDLSSSSSRYTMAPHPKYQRPNAPPPSASLPYYPEGRAKQSAIALRHLQQMYWGERPALHEPPRDSSAGQ